MAEPAHRSPRSWRVRVGDGVVCFDDRLQGRQCQAVTEYGGDFVLLRADGPFAYQLAVVVDECSAGYHRYRAGRGPPGGNPPADPPPAPARADAAALPPCSGCCRSGRRKAQQADTRAASESHQPCRGTVRCAVFSRAGPTARASPLFPERGSALGRGGVEPGSNSGYAESRSGIAHNIARLPRHEEHGDFRQQIRQRPNGAVSG